MNMSKTNYLNLIEWNLYQLNCIKNAGSVDLQIKMHCEAVDFIASQKWCVKINDVYVGSVFPGILAIFLIKIEPINDDVDEQVWVVVGDLPSAYITYEGDTRTPLEALLVYIDVMGDWVDAVRNGDDLNSVIPVDVEPTLENAESLESRLEFLKKVIVPEMQ